MQKGFPRLHIRPVRRIPENEFNGVGVPSFRPHLRVIANRHPGALVKDLRSDIEPGDSGYGSHPVSTISGVTPSGVELPSEIAQLIAVTARGRSSLSCG